MLWPDTDEKEDYMKALHDLSKDSEKVTKKVSKCYLQKLRDYMYRGPQKEEDHTRMEKTVATVGEFLKIRDSIVDKRLEWVLGFPQVTVSSYRNQNLELGTHHMATDSNSHYYKFKSSCCDSHSECYLGLMNEMCTRSNLTGVAVGATMMRDLMNWMKDDGKIGGYCLDMPHPTLRFHNFITSFETIAQEIKTRMEHKI